MNFDGLCLANAEEFGQIALARLVEAERRHEEARADAAVFIFRCRDLADIPPLPPAFYRLASRLSGPSFKDV